MPTAVRVRSWKFTKELMMGLWGKRDDMIVHEADPYNAEPPPGALADRMLTPVDSFYARNHGPIPLIDPAAWRLRVGGLVEHELELSLEDLRSRFAERTLVATLQCAGNRRAGLIKVRDIPGERAASTTPGPGCTSPPARSLTGRRLRARSCPGQGGSN
jgi:DMSO/TMAO reductase YedYZ molybdopterin-dependent catalytic subunit